ncbi:formate dehydrogenase N subunit beta transmembrane domain-containing protein [Klebsiella pneumoniae]|nr:formate dehydrogenase N subunit beta transmembrane domain-containing protein [Klebsiella pneumoniae]
MTMRACTIRPASVAPTSCTCCTMPTSRICTTACLPENPEISQTVKFWKGIWKPLAAVGFAATFAASIFHYVGVGPNRAEEEEDNLHEEKDEVRK